MGFGNYFLAGVCLLLALQYRAEAIQCYACESSLDDRCGETFKYTKADEDKNMTCIGTACKKIVTTDSHKDIPLVTRGCFDANATHGLPKMGCKRFMSDGESCYCEKEFCNGRQPLHASVFLLATLLSPLLFKLY